MSRALTQKEFEKKVFDLVGDEYTVLGEYSTKNIKIKMAHNTCHNEFEMRPDNFLYGGNRCPACGKISRFNKKRKTDAQFKKEVFDLVGDEYTVLGEYGKSNSEKILFRHNSDYCNNYEYLSSPNNFLDGARCPICARKKLIESRTGVTAKKTTKQFKKEVFDLVGDEYTVLGEYQLSNCKIKMIHNENCNFEFEITPSNFLYGQRCPKCAKQRDLQRCLNRRHPIEFVSKTISELDDSYELISDNYTNGHTPILIKHKDCNTEFKMRFDDFKRGQRCPFCNRNKSKGEDEIRKFLIESNIDFKEQYRFKDCKDKRTLPFDFTIFNNDKVIGIIEYDGEHHTKIINRTKDKTRNKERLETQIRHDTIKNEYCDKNNIPLLRISYIEKKNIITLTKEFINKISTTIENTSKDGSE